MKGLFSEEFAMEEPARPLALICSAVTQRGPIHHPGAEDGWCTAIVPVPTHGASGTAAVRPQAQALQADRGQIIEREAI